MKNNLLYSFILCLLSLSAGAQNVDWLQPIVHSMPKILDRDHHIYLSADGALFKKMDASGNIVMTVPALGVQVATMKLNKSGDLFITGSFNGFVDFDPGPAQYNMADTGGNGAFLVKMDTLGNLIWAKQFAGWGGEVDLDKWGNIFVAGSFDSGDFDPGPGISRGDTPGSFVVKFDSSGNYIWHRTFKDGDLPGITYGGGILAVDSLGAVYVDVGTYGNFVSSPSNFIQKYDSSGNAEWRHNYPWVGTGPNAGTAGYGISGMTFSDSGFLYITGGAEYRSQTIYGKTFVEKMTMNGGTIFEERFGMFSDFCTSSFDFDKDGNIYVFSTVNGSGNINPDGNYLFPPPGPSTAMLSAFIVKLHPDGHYVWGTGIYSTAHIGDWIMANSILVDDNCDIYLHGYTQEPNMDVEPGQGVTIFNGAGHFLEKISCQALSTQDIRTAKASSLKVYPNPTNDFVNISATESITQLSVTDICGRIILAAQPAQKDFKFKPGHPGLYFVSITTANNTTVEKLLVQ